MSSNSVCIIILVINKSDSRFAVVRFCLYVGSFNYFSYTIQIGSNWYMDTGARDLEVVYFKANSTRINDIGSKDLSNRPIYTVLNT